MIDPVFKQEHDFARCKYPSKICRNVRTRKRNGQLHRFCEVHRTRANQNQKRWSASRQKRWDALAEELGQGFELPHPADGGSPTASTTATDTDADADDDKDADHSSDMLMRQLPWLSLDDYECAAYEFDATPLEDPANSADLSWQDAATDELREFLGDLLLSIASEDAVPRPPTAVVAAPPATAWPSFW